jgi:hypothetical protein
MHVFIRSRINHHRSQLSYRKTNTVSSIYGFTYRMVFKLLYLFLEDLHLLSFKLLFQGVLLTLKSWISFKYVVFHVLIKLSLILRVWLVLIFVIPLVHFVNFPHPFNILELILGLLCPLLQLTLVNQILLLLLLLLFAILLILMPHIISDLFHLLFYQA